MGRRIGKETKPDDGERSEGCECSDLQKIRSLKTISNCRVSVM